MKHRNLTLIILILIFCLSVTCLAACEEPFDVKIVSVEQNVFTYDGSAKNITLKGVPETVTATIVYYAEETHETVITNPTDAGTYYAVVSFKNAKSGKECGELTTTLTIDKSDYATIDFDINGEYLTDETGAVAFSQTTQSAIEKYGQIYFEINRKYDRIKVSAANIKVDGNLYAGSARVRYYSAINEDGTFDTANSVQSNPILQNIGDKIYIEVTVSDDNHNALTTYKVVSLERITKRYISNYEELCQMYEDFQEFFAESNNNNSELLGKGLQDYRWVLTNDIDCGNNVWKVIGSAYFTDNQDSVFTGEFDGRGHTIKNIKITNDSVKNINTTNGINVGLFGYTVNARIHDFTIENMSIEINTAATDNTPAYIWSGINPVYSGFVVGRCGSASSGTQIYNINVNNSRTNVNAYKAIVGGIVGFDEYNIADENVIRRDNLNLNNCELYAVNRQNNQRIQIGGLAGDIKQYTSTDPGLQYFVPMKYTNCSLTNIKLGYDYESWKAEYDKTQNKDNEFISSAGFTQSYVAAFVGYARSQIIFENCSIENYTIATNGKTGYYSYVDAGNGSSIPVSSVTLTNCAQVKGSGEFAGIWDDGAERADENIQWQSTSQVNA